LDSFSLNYLVFFGLRFPIPLPDKMLTITLAAGLVAGFRFGAAPEVLTVGLAITVLVPIRVVEVFVAAARAASADL
jgi:hypothetical protein